MNKYAIGPYRDCVLYGSPRKYGHSSSLLNKSASGSEKIAKGPPDLSKSSSERSCPRYRQQTVSSTGKILGEKIRSNSSGGKAEQLPEKSETSQVSRELEDISPISAISSSPKQRSKQLRK